MSSPAPFTVSSDSSPGVVVVTGEVDLDTAPTVRDEILRHLHGGADVHLDLGQVTFMDSSGCTCCSRPPAGPRWSAPSCSWCGCPLGCSGCSS